MSLLNGSGLKLPDWMAGRAKPEVPALQRMREVGCSECGIVFALPFNFYQARMADTRVFSCPNGHAQRLTQVQTEEM